MQIRSKFKELLIAGILCGIPPLHAEAQTNTAPRLKVVVASTQPADSLSGKAAQMLATLAAKYSNGTIDGQYYPAGQLGQFPQLVTGIKAGTVHAFFINPDALGQVTELATVGAWPYLFDNTDQMMKAWGGPVGRELLATIEAETGFRMLAPAWDEPRAIFVGRVVTDLASMKGMKVRTPGVNVFVNTMRLLGLRPTPIAAGEVYTAMQQRVIDGADLGFVAGNGFKLQEVSKSIFRSSHVISPKVWIMWGKWIESLNPEHRAAVIKAATESSAWYSEQARIESKQIAAAIEKAGVKLVELNMTVDQMRAIVAPIRTLQPKLAAWADKLGPAGR